MNGTVSRIITLLTATLAIMLGSVQPMAGAELHVPAGFETIQSAVEMAADGDHVIVAPGIYHEAIDLLGKKITLRSSTGAKTTVLDGAMQETSIITAISGESTDTRVQGFTFRNGIGRFTGACNIGGHLGGGIFVQNGGISVLDSIFENNGIYDAAEDSRSISGGAAIFACEADLRVSGSEFRRNLGNHGGAIRFSAVDKEAVIVDSRFSNNDSAFGGGIQSVQFLQSNLSIANCHFDANTSTHGGGVYVRTADRATARITGSSFRNGVSSFGGGANLVALDRGRIELTDIDFLSNEAGFGGGMFAMAQGVLPAVTGGRITVDKARFMGNTAHPCCDTGKYVDSCFADGLEETELFYGGGADVRMMFGGIVTITNSLFARNDGMLGGGMHMSSCNGGIANLVNNTIVDNEESGLHLRLALFDMTGSTGVGEIHVTNSIIRDNNGVSQIPLEILADLPIAAVTFSNVHGGFEGDGNIDVPPMYVDESRCDYRLRTGSAGIDAGTNHALADSDGTDLRRVARFVDDPETDDTGSGDTAIVDMGAYERQLSEPPSQGRRRVVSSRNTLPCPDRGDS